MDIDMTAIKEIFHHRGLPPRDCCRAMLSAIRSAAGGGPVLLYPRDWRALANPAGGFAYRIVAMDGVTCTAPMYGLMTRRRWALLMKGPERGMLIHKGSQGLTEGATRWGFREREAVRGYFKANLGQPNDPDGFFLVNFLGPQEGWNNEPTAKALGQIADILSALLPRLLIPTQEDKDRHIERTEAIERMTTRIVPTMTTPDEAGVRELLAEILLSAQGSLRATGVWGSIHRRTRKCLEQTKEAVWVLEHVAHCGVPDQLLVGDSVGAKSIESDVRIVESPCFEHGILSWVAYHGTPLFIRDINNPEYSNPRFNLRGMYRTCWKGTCAEIALPIRDPDNEENLYGVINFEARDQHTLSLDDMYYLELFASQAAIPLKSAHQRQMIDCVMGASVQDNLEEAFTSVGEQLCSTLGADGVTAWSVREVREGSAPRALCFVKEAGSFLAESIRSAEDDVGKPRDDGWTHLICEAPAECPTAFLLHIAYGDDAPKCSDDPAGTWHPFAHDDGKHWVMAQRLTRPRGAASKIVREGLDAKDIRDVSQAVLKSRVRTQLGLPLVCAKGRPLGALWIKWLEPMIPVGISDQDMMWLFSLGTHFGEILSLSSLRSQRHISGLLHDLGKDVFRPARQLAEDRNVKGIKLLIDYFRAVAESYNPQARRTQKVALRRDSSGKDVKTILLDAVCVAHGDFEKYSSSTNQYEPAGTICSLPHLDQVRDWCLGAPEGDGSEGDFLLVAAVSLLINARKHGFSTRVHASVREDGPMRELIVSIQNLTNDPVTVEILNEATEGSGGLYLVGHVVRWLLAGKVIMEVSRDTDEGPARVTATVVVPVTGVNSWNVASPPRQENRNGEPSPPGS